ncbi:MAG: hypothetical protein CMJ18_07555 [Phycisphaeraceae bacterium]|nr:hypothetical protein [Phycisphaeraceae bacterium]
MTEGRLQDKVCIVTGSTAGIGAAIAELFAEQGASVVVCGRRAERAEAIAHGLCERGFDAMGQRCDVTDDGEMDRLVADTVGRFGGLDVLVNNAADVIGAHGPDRDVERLSVDDWESQVRTDLRSVYYMSKRSIPHMRQRGGGTIVNVSSVGSVIGWPKGAAYLACKGAVNQLTRSMAIDYMKDHIRVNALCPGWIRTETELKRIEEDPALAERQCEQMGIARLGEPREMANAALFLACAESSYVTGTALFADGGWTLR